GRRGSGREQRVRRREYPGPLAGVRRRAAREPCEARDALSLSALTTREPGALRSPSAGSSIIAPKKQIPGGSMHFLTTGARALRIATAAAFGLVALSSHAQSACDEKCLKGFMDSYLQALAKHDPASLALA